MPSKCDICSGREFRHGKVQEVFRADGRYVLVEHIPTTVCIQCGKKTFDAATAESVRQMLHAPQHTARSVAMEVLSF